MNIFNTTKQEIKELVKLAVYIERFDSIKAACSIEPTQDALDKRKQAEIRYVTLLEKYTE